MMNIIGRIMLLFIEVEGKRIQLASKQVFINHYISLLNSDICSTPNRCALYLNA